MKLKHSLLPLSLLLESMLLWELRVAWMSICSKVASVLSAKIKVPSELLGVWPVSEDLLLPGQDLLMRCKSLQKLPRHQFSTSLVGSTVRRTADRTLGDCPEGNTTLPVMGGVISYSEHVPWPRQNGLEFGQGCRQIIVDLIRKMPCMFEGRVLIEARPMALYMSVLNQF